MPEPTSQPAMTRQPDGLPPVGAILDGPHWPARVRVVRVEPHGTRRVLIEAVTLDDQACPERSRRARLISRLLRCVDPGFQRFRRILGEWFGA